LAVSLDGTTALASLITDATGSASTTVTLAKNTKPGAHTVVATAADGTANSAPLTVIKACVPYPGPHASIAQYLAWLIAVLTGKAC